METGPKPVSAFPGPWKFRLRQAEGRCRVAAHEDWPAACDPNLARDRDACR